MLLRHMAPKRLPPPRATVDPVYLHVLLPSVCQNPDPHIARQCLANLHYAIPPIEEQQHILKTLQEAAELVNIRPILAPLFNFLTAHDQEHFDTLLRSYQEYELITQRIQALIELSQPLLTDIQET